MRDVLGACDSKSQMYNEKKCPGCLLDIWGIKYPTQLCEDYKYII